MSAPTPPGPTEEQQEVRQAAGRQLDSMVPGLAEDGFGAVRTEEPIEGYKILTRTRLDDPTAGIRAAMLIRDVGTRLVKDWARNARAAGRSWDEIGEAFGLLQEGQPFNRAEAAFEYVAEDQPLPENETGEWRPRFDRHSVGYHCTSCGQWVTDTGPYNGHPDDDMSGHAADCALLAAAVATWRARFGDDS